MFIVGINLKELVEKYKVVEDVRDVEETCIELRLYKIIKKLCTSNGISTIRYGDKIPEEYIEREDISEKGLIIKPQETVLACSSQRIFIPQGFMGMIQTKGSLARLFVFAQCSGLQIDSGFKGRVTFELYNASKFDILLQKNQKVANLYLMPVSDKNVKLYEGKYNNADEPTIQMP